MSIKTHIYKYQICGSLEICEHRNPNHQIELMIIEKEMRRLGIKPIDS